MCCPSKKVIKSDTKRFSALGVLHEDKLCDTLQAIFKMTKEGTFTMISRVVVVRYLGGLLCAVGPMVSLF